LCSGSSSGELQTWGFMTGAVHLPIQGPTLPIYGLCASSDGRFLYAIRGKAIASYNLVTRTMSWSVALPALWSMCICPEGRFLYVGSRRSGLACLDAATGQKLLGGHSATVTALSVSPDGKTLCTGGFDGTVVLWDI
ncbi:quinon protein alcohol dehydrogenase-like superfamily, partial [Blyttiomyces helicus]